MRRRATIALLAMALCACGDARPDDGPTSIHIAVRPDDGALMERVLDCGAGRLSTVERRACRSLDRIGADGLRPVPAGQGCTAQALNPGATARVHGVVAGEDVDAEFVTTNGCEIKRWLDLAWLLGDPRPTRDGSLRADFHPLPG